MKARPLSRPATVPAWAEAVSVREVQEPHRIAAYVTIDPDARRVVALGFGRYAGDDVPPAEASGALAAAARERSEPIAFYALDDGQIVWEGECRIIDAVRMRNRLETYSGCGYTITWTSISAIRAGTYSST